MTNDDTILKEVDQALADEKTSENLRKNLPAIIAAALVVVVGVGGWQYWSVRQRAAAEAASVAYDEALQASGEAQSSSLGELAQGGGGYAALARLRLAAERAANGEREAALAFYREVYESGDATKRVKDVARIRAAYLSIADGRDAVLKDVGPLETDKTAIGFYAREIIGLAAIGAGDYQAAEEIFRKAAAAPDAPEAIRLRAGEFAALAGAGKAGVALPAVEESGKTDAERLIETLEEAGEDLSSLLKEQAPGEDGGGLAEQDGPPQPEGNE
jgi:hypothetical protein